MRVIGIDLGSKRIGIAISDSGGVLATPYDVVVRSGDRERDRRAVLAMADEIGAERIVVGLPLSLDGSVGPAAKAALAEADALAARTSLPVETYDERLTTVTADRSLRILDVKGEARKRVIDQLAAAVMLQAWLDGPAKRPAADPDAPADRTNTEGPHAPARPRRRRSKRPSS